mgnify:CR=1 FL=1
MILVFGLLSLYVTIALIINIFIGSNGFYGPFFTEHAFLKVILYYIGMAHITITAMSLSFHRQHTHKGVTINKFVDMLMQIWLWCITGMSKLDWVSVHLYHHAHSDKEKDPHSPVQKGFWRVFLLGVKDYAEAKSLPPVLRIRESIPTNALERFIARNTLVGPGILTGILLVIMGPFWGSIIGLLNFSISPLFAVGGVNAIAHCWGYQNHDSRDNSRNIGFLFPLNFIICGELDHNNHHAHPRSSSFRHRWFEFDIGYAYLVMLQSLGLAKINNAYTTTSLKEELKIEMWRQFNLKLNTDFRFQEKLEKLAQELGTTYSELVEKIKAYFEGQKVKLEKPIRLMIDDIRRTIMDARRSQLAV